MSLVPTYGEKMTSMFLDFAISAGNVNKVPQRTMDGPWIYSLLWPVNNCCFVLLFLLVSRADNSANQKRKKTKLHD